MRKPLQPDTPVVVRTTGRLGRIFKIHRDWLGPGQHAYLVWMDGGRHPHEHDKFVRSDLKVLE